MTHEKMGARVKAKLFSLFIILKWVPSILLDSRTIFIPKKNDVTSPAHLRPISISSILLRQFHKVLVKMIFQKLRLSEFQFGFRPLNGVAKGIDLLNNILKTTQVIFVQ